MRSAYFTMALLTGALAANLPGVAAILHVARLSTSDRDDVPLPRAIKAQEQAGVDDEERWQTFNFFLTKIIRSSKKSSELIKRGELKPVIKMVEEMMSPSDIFDELKIEDVEGNLLANVSWLKWAFCVFRIIHREDLNLAIVRVMVDKFGYVALAKKLLDAAAISETKVFAKELLQVIHLDGRAYVIKSLTYFKELKLNIEVDDIFESLQFKTWSNYLIEHGGMLYANDPIDFEISVFRQYYGVADLLKMLTSPGNANHDTSQKYLDKLRTVWLTKKELPSTLVSQLALNEAQDHILFDRHANKRFVDFWVGYWKQFNIENPYFEETMVQTLTNAVGPDRAEAIRRVALNTEDEDSRNFAADNFNGPNN